MSDYSTLLYERDGRVARITLNRPEKLNAINREMPRELQAAVEEAGRDGGVHVIVLCGAGRAFCAGYDLELFAEKKGPEAGTQEMPWDPFLDYQYMSEDNRCFLSLWRSLKTAPAIGRLHAMFEAEIAEAGIDGEPVPGYALYEYLEWRDRQSKYVAGTQRSYDFFGRAWRLPLWVGRSWSACVASWERPPAASCVPRAGW